MIADVPSGGQYAISPGYATSFKKSPDSRTGYTVLSSQFLAGLTVLIAEYYFFLLSLTRSHKNYPLLHFDIL